MVRIFTWESWSLHGWGEKDLALAINHCRSKIRTGVRTIACMRFERFIGNAEYFEEDLAEARALSRVPKPDYGRQEVLRTTWRREPIPSNVRTPADILAGRQALADFVALKESL
jgi:hypothetical protein